MIQQPSGEERWTMMVHQFSDDDDELIRPNNIIFSLLAWTSLFWQQQPQHDSTTFG
jgi:hypothetical protein